jgi:hypothetical protein
LGGRRAAEEELEAIRVQTQAAAEAVAVREGLEQQLLAARAELAEVRRYRAILLRCCRLLK